MATAKSRHAPVVADTNTTPRPNPTNRAKLTEKPARMLGLMLRSPASRSFQLRSRTACSVSESTRNAGIITTANSRATAKWSYAPPPAICHSPNPHSARVAKMASTSLTWNGRPKSSIFPPPP